MPGFAEPRYRLNPTRWAPSVLLLAGIILLCTGCNPTVRVEAPKEPIRIDLNVRIEQDVLIRLERSVEDMHKSNPGIF